MDTNSNKLFYTPEEFRNILGCSRSLCYESLRQNLIHSFKLGNKYFIPESEVERLRQVADDNASSMGNDNPHLF